MNKSPNDCIYFSNFPPSLPVSYQTPRSEYERTLAAEYVGELMLHVLRLNYALEWRKYMKLADIKGPRIGICSIDKVDYDRVSAQIGGEAAVQGIR